MYEYRRQNLYNKLRSLSVRIYRHRNKEEPGASLTAPNTYVPHLELEDQLV